MVGTIRPKPCLPSKKDIDGLKLGLKPFKESVAFFNHNEKINAVYKKVKTKKHVAVLTTIHNTFTYTENDKTEAHMFYNASKGGVDAFDMMCSSTNTGRKTRRWPLCIFYNILNIIMNNSFIIHNHRHENKADRFKFLESMSHELCQPYAVERYNLRIRNLDYGILRSMRAIFRVEGPAAPPPARMETATRQRCRLCPSTLPGGWKKLCNGNFCEDSNRPICNAHSVVLCHTCWRHMKWSVILFL